MRIISKRKRILNFCAWKRLVFGVDLAFESDSWKCYLELRIMCAETPPMLETGLRLHHQAHGCKQKLVQLDFSRLRALQSQPALVSNRRFGVYLESANLHLFKRLPSIYKPRRITEATVRWDELENLDMITRGSECECFPCKECAFL